MNQLNEELLNAWLRATSVVDNGRLVRGLPFNEAYICNLLYRQQMKEPEEYLTATELCDETRILKSQMNKVLVSLETKGMIERFRSTEDRRKVYIRIAPDKVETYLDIHARTMELVEHVAVKLGEVEAAHTMRLLNAVAEAIDEFADAAEE